MKQRFLTAALLFISMTALLQGQSIDQQSLAAAREALAQHLFEGDDPYVRRCREAFLSVERERYISGDYRTIAYRDMPVPLGGGLIQPAPSMIASILLEAAIAPFSRVLVIGRRSDYLNAILSELTENLFVLDPDIRAENDRSYNLKSEAGYFGWLEEGPFQTIIIFGALEEIPQVLVAQLNANGRIIAPLEGKKGNQMLISAVKYASGFTLSSIGESYIHRLR